MRAGIAGERAAVRRRRERTRRGASDLQYRYSHAGIGARCHCANVTGNLLRAIRADELEPVLADRVQMLALFDDDPVAQELNHGVADGPIMVRGNGVVICGITLTNTEASQDNFQVFLKPKCDPAIAAFAPTRWRLDHGQMLLLSAKGDIWQFEADDNAQWRRVPDSADPLIMLRQ